MFWATRDLETKLGDSNITVMATELSRGWTEDCQSLTGLELP